MKFKCSFSGESREIFLLESTYYCHGWHFRFTKLSLLFHAIQTKNNWRPRCTRVFERVSPCFDIKWQFAPSKLLHRSDEFHENVNDANLVIVESANPRTRIVFVIWNRMRVAYLVAPASVERKLYQFQEENYADILFTHFWMSNANILNILTKSAILTIMQTVRNLCYPVFMVIVRTKQISLHFPFNDKLEHFALSSYLVSKMCAKSSTMFHCSCTNSLLIFFSTSIRTLAGICFDVNKCGLLLFMFKRTAWVRWTISAISVAQNFVLFG